MTGDDVPRCWCGAELKEGQLFVCSPEHAMDALDHGPGTAPEPETPPQPTARPRDVAMSGQLGLFAPASSDWHAPAMKRRRR